MHVSYRVFSDGTRPVPFACRDMHTIAVGVLSLVDGRYRCITVSWPVLNVSLADGTSSLHILPSFFIFFLSSSSLFARCYSPSSTLESSGISGPFSNREWCLSDVPGLTLHTTLYRTFSASPGFPTALLSHGTLTLTEKIPQFHASSLCLPLSLLTFIFSFSSLCSSFSSSSSLRYPDFEFGLQLQDWNWSQTLTSSL